MLFIRPISNALREPLIRLCNETAAMAGYVHQISYCRSPHISNDDFEGASGPARHGSLFPSYRDLLAPWWTMQNIVRIWRGLQVEWLHGPSGLPDITEVNDQDKGWPLAPVDQFRL